VIGHRPAYPTQTWSEVYHAGRFAHAFPDHVELLRFAGRGVDGLDFHAKSNGYYFLAGALGGLGEKYHAGNAANNNKPSDCLRMFANAVLLDEERAKRIAARFVGDDKPKALWETDVFPALAEECAARISRVIRRYDLPKGEPI
jgi:hypothetical protein